MAEFGGEKRWSGFSGLEQQLTAVPARKTVLVLGTAKGPLTSALPRTVTYTVPFDVYALRYAPGVRLSTPASSRTGLAAVAFRICSAHDTCNPTQAVRLEVQPRRKCRLEELLSAWSVVKLVLNFMLAGEMEVKCVV